MHSLFLPCDALCYLRTLPARSSQIRPLDYTSRTVKLFIASLPLVFNYNNKKQFTTVCSLGGKVLLERALKLLWEEVTGGSL
jgi:hypothetical protein